MGNLVRDPETRYSQSGKAICGFTLANNRRFKRGDGGEGEEVCFVDVTVFGKQGEAVGKHLSKGSRCLIEGRLKLDQWEDKDSGSKRSKLKITAERVDFLDRREESDRDMASSRQAAPQQAPAQHDDTSDENLPW